jgi:hypothetical protein
MGWGEVETGEREMGIQKLLALDAFSHSGND